MKNFNLDIEGRIENEKLELSHSIANVWIYVDRCFWYIVR